VSFTALILAAATTTAPASPLVEQIDGFGFYQMEAPSFSKLDVRQKRLAYWLSRAAIAIDPVIYDQLSSYGLPAKKLLGALVEKPERLPPESRDAIVRYAKLFFGNRGNHNETTNQKFLPEFTFEQLQTAAKAALAAGAPRGTPESLDKLLADLKQPLFEPAFEPTITEKNPPKGKDTITGSANTFYGPGVSFADVEKFDDQHPLNSRVVKENGKLVEQVYRTGTPDGTVKPGLYAKELGQVVEALQEARAEADKEQRAVIDALIKYYQTGDAKDWHAFNVKWVRNDANVDFVNGFIETYRDARAAKGAAESIVTITDKKLNPLMQKLASNALYFEKKAPWADAYKKLDVKPPVGKAVEAVMETGDFGMGTIGLNLPNEEDIHRDYGTKNFLFTNTVDVFNRTRGEKVVGEFQPADLADYKKYGTLADNLITAMHEITGHGSGKSRTNREPRETLREHYSALEEARSDLVAYWNAMDPKLAQMGVKDQKKVAMQMYRQMARSIFGVLNHYPTGDQAEEDHDRDRLLIWNWVAERGGIGLEVVNGKHVAVVKDFDKAHKAVGELLAELMRIKGEGDYESIKALIEKYGLKFDPKLRDEVVARFKALKLPTYHVGIYGDFVLAKNKKGEIADVGISYGRDFLKQQLEFARLNGTLGF
jgi:dipeptidyl-peptidase-3